MIISNSEVGVLDQCERLHYYRFSLGLQPRQTPHYMQLGLVGHKVLEEYYRAALTTSDHKQWYIAGMEELMRQSEIAQTEDELDIVSLIRTRFDEYMKYYRGDKDWRIVDVEGRYNMPLSPDIIYGMTLDLLVEAIAGPYKGQYLVVDHKFCYNFQTPEEMSMNAQIPKYISTLKFHGFKVSRGILNQIRYRTDIRDVNKLFRRSTLKPPDVRLEAIMNEQLIASRRVYDRARLPVHDYRSTARRQMSKWNCGNCAFRLPCILELDGRDAEASRVLATQYTESQYGYRGT